MPPPPAVLVLSLLCTQVRAIGASRLVLDLSCRARDGRYYVCTDRWQRFTDLQVDARSLAALAASCSVRCT